MWKVYEDYVLFFAHVLAKLILLWCEFNFFNFCQLKEFRALVRGSFRFLCPFNSINYCIISDLTNQLNLWKSPVSSFFSIALIEFLWIFWPPELFHKICFCFFASVYDDSCKHQLMLCCESSLAVYDAFFLFVSFDCLTVDLSVINSLGDYCTCILVFYCNAAIRT